MGNLAIKNEEISKVCTTTVIPEVHEPKINSSPARESSSHHPASVVYEVADESDSEVLIGGEGQAIYTAAADNSEAICDFEATAENEVAAAAATETGEVAAVVSDADISFEETLDHKLREAGLLEQFVADKGKKPGNTGYRRVLKFFSYSGLFTNLV